MSIMTKGVKQVKSLPEPTRRQVLAGGAAGLLLGSIQASAFAAQPNRSESRARNSEGLQMDTFTTKDGVKIFYKDWGSGQPIVFHHGWPLTADDWDAQMMYFLLRGYRVIAHDRRGHGRSTQTAGGRRQRHGHLCC